jgi:hypothetical protein
LNAEIAEHAEKSQQMFSAISAVSAFLDGHHQSAPGAGEEE